MVRSALVEEGAGAGILTQAREERRHTLAIALVGRAEVVDEFAFLQARHDDGRSGGHTKGGEKQLVSDLPSEKATVVSGFDSAPDGHVSIRGEIWRASRAQGDSGALTTGMTVYVVDREGLTLIVSTAPG